MLDVTAKVHDERKQISAQTCWLEICPPPPLECDCDLPVARVGKGYRGKLTVSGGVPPYRWEIEGQLPRGLELNPDTGEILGTPAVAGRYEFMKQVTDSKQETRTARCSIRVDITPDCDQLPVGVVGQNYAGAFLVRGGTPPYTWEITSGEFPGELSFERETQSAMSEISGTPRSVGTSNFTLRVTDGLGLTGMTDCELPVWDIDCQLPEGKVGEAYSEKLAVEGGMQPYEWAIISGELHPDLSLSSETGEVSGEPKSPLQKLTVKIESPDPPGMLEPRRQPVAKVTLEDGPAAEDLSGTLTLAFKPNVPNDQNPDDNRPDDTVIQFAFGEDVASNCMLPEIARQVAFTISNGRNSVTLRNGNRNGRVGEVGFQSGTTAGDITVSGALDNLKEEFTFAVQVIDKTKKLTAQKNDCEIKILQPALPTDSRSIKRNAPVAVAARVQSSGGSNYQILIEGYSTTRELQVDVPQFTVSPGVTAQTRPRVIDAINQDFRDGYGSFEQADYVSKCSPSEITGGQFTLTIDLTVDGDPNQIDTVSVTLRNTVASTICELQFPNGMSCM